MARTRQASMTALAAILIGGAGLAFGQVGGDRAIAASDAARRFQTKLAALDEDDARGRARLGRWAEERGLIAEAFAAYRDALRIDRDQEIAYERWVKLASEHNPPADRERRQSLRKRFGEMELLATDHFLVLYDGDEDWARLRGALLEKAHDAFYKTFRRMGFRPWPLTGRLVCVLYDSHDDYVAYSKREDGVDLGWAAGYYSTKTNRIVFYDDRNGPRFKEVAARVEELESRRDDALERLDKAVRSQAHGSAIELRAYLREVNEAVRWYRNRKESMARVGNASKTVHEAVHQLAFNSRLQSRRTQYPFWLSEGLATNFEPDEPFDDFGPFHPNRARREGFQEQAAEGRLEPLASLVAIGRPDSDDVERLANQYDHAWALFRFLFRFERDKLRSYMAELATNPGVRSGNEMRREFVEAFGSLERLEKRMQAYARRVR